MKSTLEKFPLSKSVVRISRIPVVETGYNFATDLYNKIKKSNGLITWSFNSAEASVMLAVEITLPAVLLFETPLHTVDNLICRSIEIVEERIPLINYPPKVMYHKTKDYVSTKVVQPVLKRADSVKQISLHNASKYSEMAATKLDNALDIADKYVDKYLPDVGDNPSDTTDSSVNPGGSKTAQTIRHVNVFSKKLQRRLTRRTIAEARALKQQSADTLQCLIYLADLLARDPKAFMEKVRTMWAHLSEDEPENQVPPANLEQLIAMLTREVARRVVHLVNYTGSTIKNVPRRVNNTIHVAVHNINSMADYVLKKIHLDSLKITVVAHAKLQYGRARDVVTQIKVLGINLLERIISQVSSATHHIHASSPLKPLPSPAKTPAITASPSPKNSSPQSSNNEQSSPKGAKNSSPKEQNQDKNNSSPQKKKGQEKEKEKSPQSKDEHAPEDTVN